MDRRTVLGTAATLLLGGCASGMVGRDNGPEPFGGKAYRVEPPSARLRRTLKIVLLTFKDERPKNSRNLEWTRQASNYSDTVGQATEVRPEFENAIRAGLAAHSQIRLVPREIFLQDRDADMVISGRIVRCDADRKMAWSNSNFIGESVIEVTLRDRQGKQLWSKPLQFKRQWSTRLRARARQKPGTLTRSVLAMSRRQWRVRSAWRSRTSFPARLSPKR
jgi:hypothetical protein